MGDTASPYSMPMEPTRRLRPTKCEIFVRHFCVIYTRPQQRYLIRENCVREGTHRSVGACVSLRDIDGGRRFTITTHPGGVADRGRCHVHPHPKFCLIDRYIRYTRPSLIDLVLL